MASSLYFARVSARPQARVAPQQRSAVRVARPVVVRAAPTKNLDAQITEALSAADAACADSAATKDCAVAWDQAEELLAAKAHKRVTDADNSDPMEAFCKDAPDADECRVYED